MSHSIGFAEAQAPAYELMRTADEGLAFTSLTDAAPVLGLTEINLGVRLMGKATYYRMKKQKNARLNPTQSATILRQLRLRAFANKVFRDEARAQRFMAKPHPMLNNLTPLDAGFNEFGAQAVTDLLGQAQYGAAV